MPFAVIKNPPRAYMAKRASKRAMENFKQSGDEDGIILYSLRQEAGTVRPFL